MGFFRSAHTDVGISSSAWPLMQHFCHTPRHHSITSQGGATHVLWKGYREKVEVSKPPCQSSLHLAPPLPLPRYPNTADSCTNRGVEGARKI